MAPKKTEDSGDNEEKVNFSKTQLSVIIGSVAAIVVLAVALGLLMKEDNGAVEEEAPVEAVETTPATELPPLPEGTQQAELDKLEGALPTQVPLTPEEELAKKAEQKAAAPAPVATPVPAPASQAKTPAPAAPQVVAQAPAAAPGTITEKTATAPQAKETTAAPVEEKKTKKEKPKKKKVGSIHRIEREALNKKVDVQKKTVAARAEEPKETKKPKLENQTTEDSFSTELTPPPLPPAPATVEPAPKPAPASAAAPAPAPAAAVTPDEPAFTLFAETKTSEDDARAAVAELKKKGYYAYYFKAASTKKTWYRVMVGTYATENEAQSAADALRNKEGIKAKILPYEKP